MNNAIQLKAADAFVSAHGYSASVVRLRNTSAVSIDYSVSGGDAVELAAGASAVVDVAALTSEISVRRTDLSTTPVDVMLEFGLDPDEAYVFAVENAPGSPISSTPQFAKIGLGAAADDTYLLNLNGALVHGTSTGVGIGTSSPAARLDLGASTGVVQYVYKGDGANAGLGINLSGGASELSLFAGATGDDAGRISFGRRRVDTGDYTERMVIDGASGAVKLNSYGAGTLATDSSGNVTASSDASLKTVTGSFTRGLADVLKLTPRTYHWKESSGMNTEDENVGFIAQEVLDAVPEAVGQYRTSEVEVDGKKTKKREKAELLTLSDRPLIAALVNAVRELNEKNTALEARVAALENGKASK